MKKAATNYFSLSGLLGPVLFSAMTIICSSLRHGYNQMNQFVSELGATKTSHAELMNYAGFIPSGLMIIVFGITLLTLLPGSVLSRIGALLISMFGLGMLVAGIYSCDEGCPQEGGSFENITHNKVSGPAFMSVIIAMFLLAFVFRRLPYWKRLWVYSLLSAIAATIFTALLLNSIASSTLTGLWQRFLLATIFLWLGIISVNLFKFSQSKS